MGTIERGEAEERLVRTCVLADDFDRIPGREGFHGLVGRKFCRPGAHPGFRIFSAFQLIPLRKFSELRGPIFTELLRVALFSDPFDVVVIG